MYIFQSHVEKKIINTGNVIDGIVIRRAHARPLLTPRPLKVLFCLAVCYCHVLIVVEAFMIYKADWYLDYSI